MLVRILTALIGLPLFLGLLYLGRWPFFALVAGMGLLGFREYVLIWRAKSVQPAYLLGSLSCLSIYAWAFLAPQSTVWLGAALGFSALSILSWQLFRYGERSVVDGLVTLAGVVYVGFLLSHMLLLRGVAGGGGSGWDPGLRWLLFAFFCTWAADTGAYFVGMAAGKRKLAPRISPGKSVEGAVGGALSAVVLGWTLAGLVGIAPAAAALLGLATSVVSVLGDLAESALKRHVGVKDSGSLLPGHGGVLDRFDSSLFVLPFVYYVMRIFFIR